mmetsp:Transcript_8055/g.12615  ORF Transcript_8055/g.12615 Transcript_8055/m.12615 type:complete len:96 (-) Transcript_8055:244-531(-)
MVNDDVGTVVGEGGGLPSRPEPSFEAAGDTQSGCEEDGFVWVNVVEGKELETEGTTPAAADNDQLRTNTPVAFGTFSKLRTDRPHRLPNAQLHAP